MDRDEYWEINQICTVEKRNFLTLSEFYPTEALTHVWSVKNGKPTEQSISKTGDNLTLWNEYYVSLDCSAYDSFTDDIGLSIGHTFKPYYFYWDENAEGFKEFGGLSINESQFSELDGGTEILALIKSKNYLVTDIFYRENFLFNINFTFNGNNENVTLWYDPQSARVSFDSAFANADGSLNLSKASREGINKAAIAPDIAVYPKSLP